MNIKPFEYTKIQTALHVLRLLFSRVCSFKHLRFVLRLPSHELCNQFPNAISGIASERMCHGIITAVIFMKYHAIAISQHRSEATSRDILKWQMTGHDPAGGVALQSL